MDLSRNPLAALKKAVFGLAAGVLLTAGSWTVYAAEDAGARASAAEETVVRLKSIMLKVMVVNPSQKLKQTFPMKAFLPAEVLPEHILHKEDLEIGYDAEKQSYFVAKEVELDPGQSVVKTIEVRDIWIIPEDKLKEISDESNQLFEKLAGTSYEDKARLLVNNMEILLTHIFELQADKTLTPEEHISTYRQNKEKMREIELDLVVLRRLVMNAGGEGDKGMGSLISLPGASTQGSGQGGAIPAWLAWQVIFLILIFLGIASGAFYWIWHRQMRGLERRKKDKASIPRDESVGFQDIFDAESKEPSVIPLPKDDRRDKGEATG
jgi:hypothetical protein